MKINIRLIYLYLFASVGLIISVIGSIRLVELGLKVIVFQGADRYDYYAPPISGEVVINKGEQQEIQDRETTRQRQRELSGAIAMIFVGFPLYLYHWKTIQKEKGA